MDFLGFNRLGEMVGLRMKRKDADGLSEDFSDFSLSSPARKMRRLDVDLPLPIKEAELADPVVFKQSQSPNGQLMVVPGTDPSIPPDGERAIVLYKPINASTLESGGPLPFTVDPNIIAGLKKRAFRTDYYSTGVIRRGEEATSSVDDETAATGNTCLAVVPWMPSQLPEAANGAVVDKILQEEQMDTGEGEAMSMDVEDEGWQRETAAIATADRTGASGGLQQFQQHCMTRHIPANTCTPVTWSW